VAELLPLFSTTKKKASWPWGDPLPAGQPAQFPNSIGMFRF